MKRADDTQYSGKHCSKETLCNHLKLDTFSLCKNKRADMCLIREYHVRLTNQPAFFCWT